MDVRGWQRSAVNIATVVAVAYFFSGFFKLMAEWVFNWPLLPFALLSQWLLLPNVQESSLAMFVVGGIYFLHFSLAAILAALPFALYLAWRRRQEAAEYAWLCGSLSLVLMFGSTYFAHIRPIFINVWISYTMMALIIAGAMMAGTWGMGYLLKRGTARR